MTTKAATTKAAPAAKATAQAAPAKPARARTPKPTTQEAAAAKVAEVLADGRPAKQPIDNRQRTCSAPGCEEKRSTKNGILCATHEHAWRHEGFRLTAAAQERAVARLVAFRTERDERAARRDAEREARKAERAAKAKDDKPRSAGSSPRTAGARKPRVQKNSGGGVRQSKPPVRPMGTGPVPSTPAGKAALASATA